MEFQIEKVKNNILLTGAGFTHNYGGFLGNEMWAHIFNNPKIQKQKCLRELLLNDPYGPGRNTNFDFEGVYSQVVNSKAYSQEKMNCMQQAVEDAYGSLNAVLREQDQNRVSIFNPIRKLLDFFKGDDKKAGLCFTLNQDQLLERYFDDIIRRLRITSNQDLDTNTGGVTVPTKQELDNKPTVCDLSKLIYIKLHGSYCWYSSDGKRVMVIGKNKRQDIEKEPILHYYYEIFKQAITTGDPKKMLIIGYGFRDEHINDALLEGIQKKKLELYIINPTYPEKFKSELRDIFYQNFDHFRSIWESIHGYFPYKVIDIFPHRTGLHEDTDPPLFEQIKLALNS